jgi:hypothetical protein
MPKINLLKKVENFFRKRRVVTMSDLCEAIGSSSRMTVFRRLRQMEYVTSYTHAGRYYTLYDIARFDSDGIWFYDDIGFSQNGSLKNTVTYLVDESDGGKFHFDLERQLRVRVHNVLLDLIKAKQIKHKAVRTTRSTVNAGKAHTRFYFRVNRYRNIGRGDSPVQKTSACGSGRIRLGEEGTADRRKGCYERI